MTRRNAKKLSIFTAAFAQVLLIFCCANPGTPTGGPKDRQKPVVVSSTPEINAKEFSGNKVVINFDENIQLKDADSKFVMSPPMEKAPKTDAHAKTITVSFDGELMPSTTYTLDFADCISDLNEGNTLDNFAFTFSTGSSTDSMMISGNVYSATDISPVKGIYVLLQANLSDTAFNTVAPIRIAKTDEYGRFAIKNVPNAKYYNVFALDDNNRNFKFDQPGETIAWLKDSITTSFEIRQIPDSVLVDSTAIDARDSSEFKYEHIMRDTLVYTPDSLVLFTFLEDRYDQYIVSNDRKKRDFLSIIFNKPMANKPKLSFPGQDASVKHSVTQYSKGNDTISIWITDTIISKGDSVLLSIDYPVWVDSLNAMTVKTDTLDFWFYEKAAQTKKSDKSASRRRKKDEGKEKKPEVPSLKLNVSGGLGVFASGSITAETPFDKFDWSGIHLSHKVDTLFYPMDYTTIDDTFNIRYKGFKAAWEPGNEYQLEIDSAAIVDVFGLACKPIKQKINITTLDKYGTLYIDIDSVPANSILQLVTGKNEVKRHVKVPKSGKVAFRYIKPAEYMLRILIDDNGNGEWDTGNYAKRLQPERYIYYMEKVNVRANWEIKVDFKVGMYTPDKYARKFMVKGGNLKGGRNNSR